jgi:hypothetical protein
MYIYLYIYLELKKDPGKPKTGQWDKIAHKDA